MLWASTAQIGHHERLENQPLARLRTMETGNSYRHFWPGKRGHPGFRNFEKHEFGIPAAQCLVDRARSLTLAAPEMTVLVDGLRVLNASGGQSTRGVFTRRPGALTNDFFTNVFEMSTEWKAAPNEQDVFEGRDRKTGVPSSGPAHASI